MLKVSHIGLVLFILSFPDSVCGQTGTAERTAESSRQVVITIDDLPASALTGNQQCDRDHQLDINRQLIRGLVAHKVPAIGFVNEGRPCDDLGAPFVRAVLSLWLDAGLELGNHTYSHASLQKAEIKLFQADVLRGEAITRALLTERGDDLRYFRHPFLQTGPDDSTRTAFETFLAEHGYTIAPVTIDNSDWTFSAAYSKALARSDSASMAHIGQAYLEYMEEVFAFYEEFSRDMLGYELPQVLLIHATVLNADYFGKLARMIENRGYSFVTLEEALQDKAYLRGDTYAGPEGLSWLQRWLVNTGEEVRVEPPVSEWIKAAAMR